MMVARIGIGLVTVMMLAAGCTLISGVADLTTGEDQSSSGSGAGGASVAPAQSGPALPTPGQLLYTAPVSQTPPGSSATQPDAHTTRNRLPLRAENDETQ